ncbi:MAG: hypothetical protein IT201_09310 [Thermoleophilia bacterium]|nr:hypothetical protein [Thermoleophilia bacterium]
MPSRLTAALALAVVALAGCGGEGRIDHPTSPTELVLRVELSGGLLPVEVAFAYLPELSLYGDGALLVSGPQLTIYPGPALPGLVARTIGEEGVQAILREARVAGLLDPDGPGELDALATVVADAPTTTFTVAAAGSTRGVSVYALGLEAGLPVPESELEARALLSAFLERLRDLESWLPEGSLGPERAYAASAVRVLVRPYAPPEPEFEQPALAWPLETPLAALGEPWTGYPDARCAVVEGDELALLVPAAERASTLTPWRSGGDDFALLFRPLFPGERGC